MPTGSDGQFYRTHGQAARVASEQADSKKAEGRSREDAVEETGDKKNMAGKTAHVRHNEDGSHDVKHSDGTLHHAEDDDALRAHVHAHPDFGGTDHESEHDGEEYEDGNDGMDSDYGSEGSKAALETLMG